MKLFGGGGDTQFTHGMLLMSLVVMLLLPTSLTMFTSLSQGNMDENIETVLDDYYDFTGARPTKEAVWPLQGIYTPYSGQTYYGYTDDGWLYGERVTTYRPSQFEGDQTYSVTRSAENGLYYFDADTPNGMHKQGDLYTSVSMDVNQKSSMFFTQNGRTDYDKWFTYQYSGFRYAFSPMADYTARDADGNPVPVTATTTSLSLIWYEYYNIGSGISGQLIISGSDRSVAYLTASEIIRAFDQTTSTAKFQMMFNGVSMNIYIRLNPVYLNALGDVETCFNGGYWELMVTSLSTDADAYLNTSFSFNVADVFMTAINLLTFNADEYGVSGWLATVLSVVYALPLYAALIAIGLDNYPVLILAGILMAIQSVTSVWPF